MRSKKAQFIFGSALMLAFTLPVGQATFGDKDWREDCHRRLEADRARIDRDVARHGERSPQADRDRDRMAADRQWCKDHRADWDHDRFDFGVYVRSH